MKMMRLSLIGCAMLLTSNTYAQEPTRSVLCCDHSNDAVVAVVEGEHVRMSDLDQYSRSTDPVKIFLLNQQLRDPREQVLQESADERLLEREAERQHLTVTQLVENLFVAPVTEDEIETILEQINAQPRANRPHVKLDVPARQLAESYLIGQKRAAARGLLVQKLKTTANGHITLPLCDCASCR